MWNYSMNYGAVDEGSYLAHHGILGQKWGVRRFQNRDGTLTEEGRKRYSSPSEQKKLADKLTRGDATSASQFKRGINYNVIASTPQVKHAVQQTRIKAKALKDAEDEFDDQLYSADRYWYDKKNSDLREEYIQKAVDEFFGDSRNPDRNNYSRSEIYEYFSNNDETPYDLFMESDHKAIRPLREAEERWDAAKKDYDQSTKNLIEQFLGEYSDTPAISFDPVPYAGYTAGKRLMDIIGNESVFKARSSFADRLAHPRSIY